MKIFDFMKENLPLPSQRWPVRLGVRTSPFHGGNAGSIPARATKYSVSLSASVIFTPNPKLTFFFASFIAFPLLFKCCKRQ